MTYTPIKTWASGNVLTGTDLNTELIGLKKFTHRIGSGDLKNTKFVDTQHVMPGTIDAQTNVTHNCTGIFGGQQHSSQSLNYTFLTKYNTTRTSANVNNIVIPETSFTIEIGRPASVLFSWWIQEKSVRSTPSGGLLNYFVGTYSDPITPNGTQKSTGFTLADRLDGSGNFVPGINATSTSYLSGFAALETSAVSFYMGLRGKTDNGQCQVMSWGVSLELFYM